MYKVGKWESGKVFVSLQRSQDLIDPSQYKNNDDMETQILKLDAPFDYIYCNGEVGKHIATLIVYDVNVGSSYELETHSHAIVKYGNTPGGVVWDRAELTDCVVLCNDNDKRVEIDDFGKLAYDYYEVAADEDPDIKLSKFDVLMELKEMLTQLDISYKSPHGEQVMEINIFIRKDGDVYKAGSDDSFCDFSFEANTLEELKDLLWHERSFWEDFYDNVVQFKFVDRMDPDFEQFLQSV